MEEQIITVHVPKDQYRKFAKLAGQVNVPMQTILSQFVLDCVSDRWGTAEGTMAKDWFANHWWSAFERADFFGWLAQSNQLDEILEAQQKLESCKKEITSLEKGLETGYIEAGGVFYSWKTVISADLTPRYKTRNEWEADHIDWDIQIVGNDCTNIEEVKKEGYLSVADGLFASKKFQKLKVNEKIMAMRLLIYCRSGQRTYKEAKENFRKKMTQLLGCKLRALKEYLTALKALFYIGIKDGMYLITIRREIADRDWRAAKDTELEYGQQVHAACNRKKIKEDEQAKKDTAELAKQYRQDIKAMQEAGTLPSDLFGYLIGKAVKEGGMTGKLNPKYIHKILRLEIANFYKKG